MSDYATAMAITASVQAAQASQEAIEAHKASCAMGMRSYQAATATVLEMRTYSKCVELLYPEQPGIEFPAKACVISCLVAVVLFALLAGVWSPYVEWRSNNRQYKKTEWYTPPPFRVDWEAIFFGGLFAAAASLTLWAVGYGIYWVFAS